MAASTCSPVGLVKNQCATKCYLYSPCSSVFSGSRAVVVIIIVALVGVVGAVAEAAVYLIVIGVAVVVVLVVEIVVAVISVVFDISPKAISRHLMPLRANSYAVLHAVDGKMLLWQRESTHRLWLVHQKNERQANIKPAFFEDFWVSKAFQDRL